VLLPQQSGGGGLQQLIMGQFGESYASRTSGVYSPQLYAQLLHSGPVLDKIIDRFDLANYYEDAESKIDLRESLKSSMMNEFIHPEGHIKRLGARASRLLKISVVDKDPVKAADMANAFVEALQDFLKDIAVSEASQKRLFFEGQLKQAREALIKSEEAMRAFQEKTGILKADLQTGTVIESIANLRAQLVEKEVELNVMKSYSTPNNPDLQRIEETIKGLKKELGKIGGTDLSDNYVTTGELPAVSTDYLRKLRDLKFHEKIYEMMMRHFEAARIEEVRDPSLIQVLEKAIPTEERAGPERRKKVIKATFSAFLFSVFLAFALEFVERYKRSSPGNRERIETLTKYLSFRKRR
jgi:capsule polysaccharide export protein KpsE/RkpR